MVCAFVGRWFFSVSKKSWGLYLFRMSFQVLSFGFVEKIDITDTHSAMNVIYATIGLTYCFAVKEKSYALPETDSDQIGR